MKYGWRGIGLPDQRDLLFSYQQTFVCESVPRVKFLISPPVVDQGDLGSCVFFALCYAMESMQLTENKIPINPSQLFAYYRYRSSYADVNRDDGAFIRDAIKSFAQGVCLEEDWPYVLRNFAKWPGEQALGKLKPIRLNHTMLFILRRI